MDPTAERLLRRIAADENLHMVFYRDLVAEAFALVPDQMLAAIAQEVARFEMPGAGLPGFHRKSVLMADAGIYDVRLHRDEVVLPLLRHWHALTISVASPAAQEAQHELSQHLDPLEAIAKHYEQRRMRRKNSSPPEVPTSS